MKKKSKKNKLNKIIVYLMIIAMLASTFLIGLSMIF